MLAVNIPHVHALALAQHNWDGRIVVRTMGLLPLNQLHANRSSDKFSGTFETDATACYTATSFRWLRNRLHLLLQRSFGCQGLGGVRTASDGSECACSLVVASENRRQHGSQ